MQLTAKAEELQRFAQEYMVKASSDKLKVRAVQTLSDLGLRPLFDQWLAVETLVYNVSENQNASVVQIFCCFFSWLYSRLLLLAL